MKILVPTYRDDVRIDILVHPYWIDRRRRPLDFPNVEVDEKTNRWKSEIDKLAEGEDFLIFVEGDPLQNESLLGTSPEKFYNYPDSDIKVKELTLDLFNYAKEGLGDNAIYYMNNIGGDVKFRMRMINNNQISKVRSYGEVIDKEEGQKYRPCVPTQAKRLEEQLELPEGFVEIVPELSVSYTGKFGV